MFIIIPPFAMIISIHVPRVGDDQKYSIAMPVTVNHFYPRPPRGGRLVAQRTAAA